MFMLLRKFVNTFLNYLSTAEFLIDYHFIEVASSIPSILKVFFRNNWIAFGDYISEALDRCRPI